MTNEQALRTKLEENFNLLCLEDVSDFSDHPGSLLKKLKSLYRESYEPNHRLAFYTTHSISEELLEHFYTTTNFLDISNFFILFVTTENIELQLKNACALYSKDAVPYGNFCTDFKTSKTISTAFQLPKTICALPWHHIHVCNDGSIDPCCVSKDYKFGSIKNLRLTDAFYGDKMQRLREQFLAGEKPDACKSCWKLEDQGLSSPRILNTKRLKEKFVTELLEQPKITSLDIKFSNVCNFKCRICGPESSSLFNVEQHKYKGIPMIEQSKWEESEMFYNQILELLPQIDNIDMYGGEPFLIKKFEIVLQTAVDTGVAKNIRLHYNSNGSVYPKMFLKWWKHFKQVDILFSIDSVGERFELERGGVWSDVENNILKLKDSGLQNLSINIMPTVGAMNVFYLDELCNWAKSHNLELFINYVRSSNGLELKDLPQQVREMVIQKFKNHSWQELQQIAQLLQELPESDGKQFYDTTRWFDKIRQQNFAKTHPEIAQAIGYTV